MIAIEAGGAVFAFKSISRQKNLSKRDENDVLDFFDIHYTKKSKQKQHGYDFLQFQEILDLWSVLNSL